MCGIAGFSLSKTSKIKPRQLSNALLGAIEDRGGMASGFAWQINEHMGFYKAAVTGSTLPLKTMPKDVRNVILHTRLATHGSVTDNRNNHPVLSPNEDIALIHNGVIYNHHQVRNTLGMTLPEVDTSVIPALLEQRGIDAIDELDGDAAIAWFNRKEHNTMHLARYKHSPLVMAQVEDGSFIFCSTETLLWKVLVALDLMPTWLQTASELEYFTIRDGVVISKAVLPEPKHDDYSYNTSYYRHQTAGAKPAGIGAWSYYDEWDDDYTPYAFNGKNTDRDAVITVEDDEFGEDDYNNDNVIPLNRAQFYTLIYDTLVKDHEYIYYYADEENLWKDELFIWANEEFIKLVDYGKIDKGELLSVTDELF
jgi:hypothetical protein